VTLVTTPDSKSPIGWCYGSAQVEAIMSQSISKFVIMAVAIAVALVGATTFGIAAAQSAFGYAKTINRIKSPVSESDFQISHHQKVRKIFFGVDRFR
jgi:hypothetical protein